MYSSLKIVQELVFLLHTNPHKKYLTQNKDSAYMKILSLFLYLKP